MVERCSMSCALIGADSLLIECGEILLAKGHRIPVVAAGAPRVARWARAKGIEVVDATIPMVQWQGELARHSFEWLFAITHLSILPDAVLQLPTKGALNFHDGPLPKYAGLNTPAWALLRGETEYGISWHSVTSGVDEGDILKQRLFDLAPSETSLSLNTRNFEAAIETFDELVEELATGSETRTPQDLTAERYTFMRSDRPEAFAVLDWRRPAEELERTIRALDFGRYPNPLGFAKLWHGGTAVLVTAAELGADDLDDLPPPGTVAALAPDHLLVTTADGGLKLTGFTSLTGVPLSAADVAQKLGLAVGIVLDPLVDEHAQALTVLGRRMAIAEGRHLALLHGLEPVELPWAATPDADHVAHFSTIGVEVPPPIAADAGRVAGALAVLLSRLAGQTDFHLTLTSAASPRRVRCGSAVPRRRRPAGRARRLRSGAERRG